MKNWSLNTYHKLYWKQVNLQIYKDSRVNVLDNFNREKNDIYNYKIKTFLYSNLIKRNQYQHTSISRFSFYNSHNCVDIGLKRTSNLKLSLKTKITYIHIDTCRDGEWLCTDGWKCITNDKRCDNVFDCPSDIIGTSADEQKGAGCSKFMLYILLDFKNFLNLQLKN